MRKAGASRPTPARRHSLAAWDRRAEKRGLIKDEEVAAKEEHRAWEEEWG